MSWVSSRYVLEHLSFMREFCVIILVFGKNFDRHEVFGPRVFGKPYGRKTPVSELEEYLVPITENLVIPGRVETVCTIIIKGLLLARFIYGWTLRLGSIFLFGMATEAFHALWCALYQTRHIENED